MIVERAFSLVHHLDVPETKRKFWPRYAEVVVDRDGTIQDVKHYFELPTETECVSLLTLYPGCVSFPVTAGVIHTTIDGFKEKVAGSAELAAKVVRRR